MKKKNIIISSFTTIALSASLLVGSTFALFTSESKVNIAVTSGKVSVIASIDEDSVQTKELYDAEYTQGVDNMYEGVATFNAEGLTLANFVPGDGIKFDIVVENESNVTVQYRTIISCESDNGLFAGLDITVDGKNYSGLIISDWAELKVGSADAKVPVIIELPEEAENEYQEKTCTISYMVEAVQGNAEISDEWDGTADISWYLENPKAKEYTLSTAEALSGLADLIDGTAAIPTSIEEEINLPVTFAGKTVKLDSDVDLKCYDENGNRVSFDPIGYGYDVVFKGTFDGQGHTISNLYQNGWSLGLDYSTEGGGLFASVVDATIKNVNIDNAEIVMECIDMGVLVGYSYGTCTYENITVSNSLIANYQRYTGGVVGEVNGTQTFKNVDVIDTTISSLWGDFDCSLGGIIGGKWGDATVSLEDCDVSCELNAYNDVTSSYQWYAYRRAGMLIGNSEETNTVDGRTSATASYLTCENCTVTYNNWANYTYCEFAGTNWPYVRVQAGYSNSAYSNPRYGVATDANGNKAVDDTHAHNEGEDHNILLVFDQLYGGGQGVYGTATHEGVTVIDNNK